MDCGHTIDWRIVGEKVHSDKELKFEYYSDSNKNIGTLLLNTDQFDFLDELYVDLEEAESQGNDRELIEELESEIKIVEKNDLYVIICYVSPKGENYEVANIDLNKDEIRFIKTEASNFLFNGNLASILSTWKKRLLQ